MRREGNSLQEFSFQSVPGIFGRRIGDGMRGREKAEAFLLHRVSRGKKPKYLMWFLDEPNSFDEGS